FKKGLPFFDGMIFTIVRDYNRRLAAMQVGQAHTTEGPTIGSYGTEDPMRVQRETKGRVRAVYISEAVQTYLVLHMNKPPFQDVRVRRAIFLAVDRQELTKDVRWGESFGCFGSVGTFLPNKGGKIVESPEDLAQTKGWRQPKTQDLGEAKALLAAAGYPNGFKATPKIGNPPRGGQAGRGGRRAAPEESGRRFHGGAGGSRHAGRSHHPGDAPRLVRLARCYHSLSGRLSEPALPGHRRPEESRQLEESAA